MCKIFKWRLKVLHFFQLDDADGLIAEPRVKEDRMSSVSPSKGLISCDDEGLVMSCFFVCFFIISTNVLSALFILQLCLPFKVMVIISKVKKLINYVCFFSNLMKFLVHFEICIVFLITLFVVGSYGVCLVVFFLQI